MIETLNTIATFIKKESESKEGKKWKIMIIEAGKSLNDTIYNRDVLVDAVPLFDNVKVYAYKFEGNFYDHLTQAQEIPEGYVGNLIGVIHNPRYEEVFVDGEMKEGIVGDLNIFSQEYRELFKNIWEEGELGAIGFSVVIEAETERAKDGIKIKKIHRAESVDVVSSPSAGGKLLRLLESKGGFKMDKQKIIDAIKKLNPQILEGVNIEGITDEELEGLLLEAINKNRKEKTEEEEEKTEKKENTQEAGGDIRLILDKIKELMNAKKTEEALTMLDDLIKKLGYGYGYGYPSPKEGAKEEEGKELKSLIDEVNRIKTSLTLEKKLNESNLPDIIKNKVKTLFEGKVFDEKELDKVLNQEKETLGKLQESFGFQIGGQDKMKIMKEELDKKEIALYNTLWGFNDLEGEDRKIHESCGRYRGLKEAYINMTGDENVEFRITESTHTTALMADFPKLLANAINKRLAKIYPKLSVDTWRKFVQIVPLTDFNPQSIIRLGSIPELATVAEGAPYASWTFTDTNGGGGAYEEKADYTAFKKGGTYELTRELIKSDKIKGLVKLPDMIVRAANRTLMRYVFDLIINYKTSAINDGTIYDGKALYHTDHSNLLTDALSFDALTKAKTELYNQTLPSITQQGEVAEVLGLAMKYLIVPIELKPTAEVLLNSERIPGFADNDINIHKGTFEIVVSPFLRGDVNNWYCMANPNEVDTIELGFVDGKDVPEVFVQDNPLMGKGFTNDVITYKVRLEFGGAIADWRPFVGAIVT